MKTVELDAIRSNPERLVQEIESGDEFVIVDHDRRIADVRPAPQPRQEPRPFGLFQGEFEVPEDFDRPMMLVDDPEFSHRYEHVEEAAPGEFLAWEGNLLVYTGPVPAGLTDASLLEQTREERHRQILHGRGE